jgi:hypothetical protein
MGIFERHSDDLRRWRADYFANPSLNHRTRYGGLSWPGLG